VRATTAWRIGLVYGVNDVAESPDGRFLALAPADRTVLLLERRHPFRRHVLRGHASTVLALAFSPDSTRLASVDRLGRVKVWDLHKAAPFHLGTEVMTSSEWWNDVVISRDGRLLVWKDSDPYLGSISALNLSTRQRSILPFLTADDLGDLLVLDQRRMVTAAGLWDVEQRTPIVTFDGLLRERIAVSRSGRFVAGATNEGMEVREMETGEQMIQIRNAAPRALGDPDPVHDGSAFVCFSPDDRLIAYVTESESEICIFRLGLDGEPRGEICRFSGTYPVVFGPLGTWLLTGLKGGGFQKVDAHSGEVLRRYQVNAHPPWEGDVDIGHWELSPDGRLAVCHSYGVKVIDLETGAEVYHGSDVSEGRLGPSSFSPDGRRLAIVGRDERVHLWCPETRMLVAVLSYRAWMVRFTADSQAMVVISPDGQVMLLDSIP
jgi:WD40 repeat protein